MIRNLIDGVDVPMKWCPDCAGTSLKAGSNPGTAQIGRCGVCRGDRLVVDVRQQRLEHQRCPDCPVTLNGQYGPRGWFACRCCGRAWRKRIDGYFDEQIPLDSSQCPHLGDPLAGSP